MLKAWHLPVAPFIKEQQERLMITLWLSGDDLPPRVTLRAEEDNEELSLPMHRLRQAPYPGVVAWRGKSTSSMGSRVGATASSCCGPIVAVVHAAGIQPLSAGEAGAVLRSICQTAGRRGGRSGVLSNFP